MRNIFLLILSMGAFSLSAYSQLSGVNPVPQEVERQGSSFRLPLHYKIVSGVRTEKQVRALGKYVPQKSEGYYIKIEKKQATVVGFDKRGLYYGLTTLHQIMQDSLLPICTIRDWPDVPFRGVVEGFYGTPWSHSARLRQLDFYGRNKLNVYIYGPKDDPYHSTPDWRKPYPEKEGKQLQELVVRAKQNGVNFYWAIHPGADIHWTVEDRSLLLEKFESMYRLGVRSFAVFFDDISGEGTRAERQAELLNYLDNNFVQKKKDVSPLIVCPTEYNRAWVNEKRGYLRTLGEKLNKSVQVMWTGNTVVHCLDKESLEWVNSRIARKAYVWWNFPVTDYCRDHLMLGPVYGNGNDIAADMAGFVSNPMEHAEASKIALYGVADYTWNMKAYRPNENWLRAVQALLPGDADALSLFASFNEDAGVNGHRFRRDESVKLQQSLLSASSQEERVSLLEEASSGLGTACNALLNNKENVGLIAELRPWLLQGKLVAEYGAVVCKMSDVVSKSDASNSFITLYHAVKSIQRQMYEMENSSVRHPLQPGIKVGSRVLVPALDSLFSQSVNRYNQLEHARLSADARYHFFSLESDVSQLAHVPLSEQSNHAEVTPVLEVIRWPTGGTLTIRMEKPTRLSNVVCNLDDSLLGQHFVLELLSAGQWISFPFSAKASNSLEFNVKGVVKGKETEAVRLKNVSGKECSVKLRKFQLQTVE